MTKTAVAFALALACGAASAQTLYKCVKGGKTVYQDSKCDEEAKQSEVRPPPPVSEAPQAAKAAAGDKAGADKAAEKLPATVDLDSAIDVVAGYQACSEAILEWDGAHRTAYEEWRMRNGSVVSRLDSDPEAQRKRLQKYESFRAGSSRTCANVISVINPGRADFMKGVRPSLATPATR